MTMKKIIPGFFVVFLIVLLTSCYDSYTKTNAKSQPLHYTAINTTKTATKVKPLQSTPSTQVKTSVAKKNVKASKAKKITYTVFGKSYKVLPDSKNYQAVGVASWYGRPFHQRYTSSGERYNMFSMTAAHKTLPLSTYVVVTNLKNHKRVLVKINDRGPFVGNRLIDLSYAAAKKLGMVGLGVTEVSIKAVTNPSALA